MKSFFIVRFGDFLMVSPANPAGNWLDFVEQCHKLARSIGPGEYWIDSEDARRAPMRFWV